jgi:hypothetical protein
VADYVEKKAFTVLKILRDLHYRCKANFELIITKQVEGNSNYAVRQKFSFTKINVNNKNKQTPGL